jgi:multidrug efflux pump subunit AcrA (membrane-fusion protein)
MREGRVRRLAVLAALAVVGVLVAAGCSGGGAPLPITMREAAQAVMVVDAIEASIQNQRTTPVRPTVSFAPPIHPC